MKKELNEKVVYNHLLSALLLNTVYTRLSVTRSLKIDELTDKELADELGVVWKQWSDICTAIQKKTGHP